MAVKQNSGTTTARDPQDRDPVRYSQAGDIFEPLHLKYKRFFDNAADMRFVTSRKGKVIDVNQAGVELFGFDDKEALLSLDSVSALFLNPDEATTFQRQLEVDGFVRDYVVEMKRQDGSIFHAAITASIWFDEDGAVSCEGFLQDITELRQWQEAFIEAERQNRELSESEAQIRKLNEHILNILMIMSHDVRGPLVSIGATLKLLLRGSFGNMDQSVVNTVNDLLERVRQLIGITEEFLGKAHVFEASGRPERETIDLRQDIIDPVLDEVSNDIERNEIMIDSRLGAIPAGSIPLNVSRMWLKAVFRNLFKNAIKYGGKRCRIAFGFEDHGSHYRLNVYNSGEPVAPEHRDKLFSKFGRFGEGASRTDGMGLGLYLIREIVRRHGGEIWYEARPDGSDFILTIAKESAQPAIL
jgi:PAS domain S-box-containing protein